MAKKQSDYEYYKALTPKALVYASVLYVAYWIVVTAAGIDTHWIHLLGDLDLSAMIVLVVAFAGLYLLGPSSKKPAAKAKAAPKKKKTTARKKR